MNIAVWHTANTKSGQEWIIYSRHHNDKKVWCTALSNEVMLFNENVFNTFSKALAFYRGALARMKVANDISSNIFCEECVNVRKSVDGTCKACKDKSNYEPMAEQGCSNL